MRNQVDTEQYFSREYIKYFLTSQWLQILILDGPYQTEHTSPTLQQTPKRCVAYLCFNLWRPCQDKNGCIWMRNLGLINFRLWSGPQTPTTTCIIIAHNCAWTLRQATLLIRLLRASLQVTLSKIIWSLGLGVWFEYTPYRVLSGSLESCWFRSVLEFRLWTFWIKTYHNRLHMLAWILNNEPHFENASQMPDGVDSISVFTFQQLLHHATPKPCPRSTSIQGLVLCEVCDIPISNILKSARPVSVYLPVWGELIAGR